MEQETRVALIGIVVGSREHVAELNGLLQEYGPYIIGRMGLPCAKRGISLISVALDAPQDIISALYGQRILPLDPIRYNMTEKLFSLHRYNGDGMTLEDVRQQSAVIHYCGRNKPWKPGYLGELNVFYEETVSQMAE